MHRSTIWLREFITSSTRITATCYWPADCVLIGCCCVFVWHCQMKHPWSFDIIMHSPYLIFFVHHRDRHLVQLLEKAFFLRCWFKVLLFVIMVLQFYGHLYWPLSCKQVVSTISFFCLYSIDRVWISLHVFHWTMTMRKQDWKQCTCTADQRAQHFHPCRSKLSLILYHGNNSIAPVICQTPVGWARTCELKTTTFLLSEMCRQFNQDYLDVKCPL